MLGENRMKGSPELLVTKKCKSALRAAVVKPERPRFAPAVAGTGKWPDVSGLGIDRAATPCVCCTARILRYGALPHKAPQVSDTAQGSGCMGSKLSQACCNRRGCTFVTFNTSCNAYATVCCVPRWPGIAALSWLALRTALGKVRIARQTVQK